QKLELLQRAWVNLTASSAEGWCLTVMEAAACATPSAAIGVGGLPESIDDGVTGLLADDGRGLTAAAKRIVDDPELRDRMGAAAPRSAPLRELVGGMARSDTGRAAGLAAAVMAANVIALVFTIVFARVLHSSGYGSLAALVSTFLILSVPGSALQMTVAREV